jgi:hypothetical protein
VQLLPELFCKTAIISKLKVEYSDQFDHVTITSTSKERRSIMRCPTTLEGPTVLYFSKRHDTICLVLLEMICQIRGVKFYALEHAAAQDQSYIIAPQLLLHWPHLVHDVSSPFAMQESSFRLTL